MDKFPFGRIVATPSALDSITLDNITQALVRHGQCDWGDLDEQDREANDRALTEGTRLFSVYHAQGVKFYVITEADRSVTTVLLPSEY